MGKRGKKENRKKQRKALPLIFSFSFILQVISSFIVLKTFIPAFLIPLFFIIPGLTAAVVFHEKLCRLFGYIPHVPGLFKVNLVKRVVQFLVSGFVIGNVLLCASLLINWGFSSSSIEEVELVPFNLRKGYSMRNYNHYSLADIEYNGRIESLPFGDIPLETISEKLIALEIQEGALGWAYIRSRRLVDTD